MEAFLYTWLIMGGLAAWGFLVLQLVAISPPSWWYTLGFFTVAVLGGPLSLAGGWYALQAMRRRFGALRMTMKPGQPPEITADKPPAPLETTGDALSRLKEVLRIRAEVAAGARSRIPYGQIVWCPLKLKDETVVYLRYIPDYHHPLVSHTIHEANGVCSVYRQGVPAEMVTLREGAIFEAPTFEEALTWVDADTVWLDALHGTDTLKRVALWAEVRGGLTI